jgi:hypothetical protein
MSVSAVAAVGVQAVVRYAPVAPVSKTEAVRRGDAAKGDKRKSASKSPAMSASRSASADTSSDVLSVLNGLQLGG